MIQTFVDRFMARKGELREKFAAKFPDDYAAIVAEVIVLIADENDFNESPDPKRIHQIDDGDYQGTQLYIIAALGYQPSNYWSVKVDYGSCSGCDSLEALKDDFEYRNDPPTEKPLDGLMAMALHIVQSIKEI